MRSDGRYGVALTYEYYDGVTGRTVKKRPSTTKPDWDAAHKWLVAKQSELLGGVAVTDDNPTLAEFLETWLADAVEVNVAPKAYEKREYICRVHIVPVLGAVRIKKLTPREIQRLHATKVRLGTLAPSTRREIHVTLKMALKQAVRWGYIPTNPADHVDAPRLEDPDEDQGQEEIRALTDTQARLLFESGRGTRWENYYVAAVRTGLRPGELLGLQWQDLDLDTDPAVLRVRRTLGIMQGGGTYFKPPKSKAGRRKLALHHEAAEAFRRQREIRQAEGGGCAKDLVFASTTGTPMNRNNLLRRYLRPALVRADLPELTLHDLRHTFASIMLFEWRVSPRVVQEMLGHRSIRMTMDIYGHLMEGAHASEIRRLNELFSNPSGQDVAVRLLSEGEGTDSRSA